MHVTSNTLPEEDMELLPLSRLKEFEQFAKSFLHTSFLIQYSLSKFGDALKYPKVMLLVNISNSVILLDVITWCYFYDHE